MPAYLSLVLFRPDWRALRCTIQALQSNLSDIAQLRILHSGATSEESELLIQLLKTEGLSQCTLVITRSDNLGFAGGHNLLLSQAFADGADCVIVVNPDIVFDRGAIGEFVRLADKAGVDALFGASLELADRHKPGGIRGLGVVDTKGIGWTAFGRHFDIDQGRPMSPSGWADPGPIVRGVSGACLLVSRTTYELIISYGGQFFDEMFVAYREDAELGVRAKALGVPSVILSIRGVIHARGTIGYRRGDPLVDGLGVRNRFLLRYKLGEARPGQFALPTLRDVLVLLGCLVRERSSIRSFLQAFAVRRWMKYQHQAIWGAARIREPSRFN